VIRSLIRMALPMALTLGLTACMDVASDINEAPRQQVNAPGVPVSVSSLDGAPQAIADGLNAAFATEAARRQISLVPLENGPRFVMKSYVSAYAVQGGTALSWVCDIYDTSSKRAQRVDGAELIKASGADPWSVVNEPALQKAAAGIMNDLAIYLASVPALPAAPAAKTPRQNKSGNGPALAAIHPALQGSAFDLAPK
jgi:hypothetical protein